MSEQKTLEELQAEVDQQKALLKKLSDQINPPPREPYVHQRYDPTEGMSMPANAMKAMVDALPSSFFADLRADARKPNPVTGGPAPSPTPQGPRGSGWIDERPLEPPGGQSTIAACDRLMDAADRQDKVALALKMAQTEAAMKQAKGEGNEK